MAALFDPRRVRGTDLHDDQILQILGDGNLSDIEDFADDDDDDIQPSILEDLHLDEVFPGPEAEEELQPEPEPVPSTSSAQLTTSQHQRTTRSVTRKRVWKQVPFDDAPHDFSSLPVSTVRSPMEYFTDYFDKSFLHEIARCTNLYHMRKTGRELKTTAVEIAKVFSIHIIIGCITYPRIPWYWRNGIKLELISNQMSRDQFLTIRNQQLEYYRSFIKTKKWTLKVLIHFLDLAIVNAWRLYRNDCLANKKNRREILPLLEFRMNIADGFACIPATERPIEVPDTDENEDEPPRRKYYRPAVGPSEARRYDGYDHFPVFDEIKAPRTCRFENCTSRSKIRCEKCDTYLCISRGKDCFKAYHTKQK